MAELRTGAIAPGIAFITGGARGLANAIAVSFARDGAQGIALVDIQDEQTFQIGKEAVEKYGTKCITIRADVTKEAEVQAAIDKTVSEFGRIDYAANFAGVLGPLSAAIDTPLEEFRRVLEVNTTGVWICTKLEMAQMMKQSPLGGVDAGRVIQRGSIVNAASVNSVQAGAGVSGYTAAKHAVAGLTKACALEGRAVGIRVNCVSPGFLLTRLLAEPIEAKAFSLDSWKQYEARQGRQASFAEVGDVVVLLSTPRMSLVVGHNLVIDGGFTINENTV